MRVLVSGPVSWNLLLRLDELPPPHPHTVMASGSHRTVGGTSAGKALNLAALGVDVTLSTVLGEDAEAELVRAALDAAGVVTLARTVADGTEQHVNLMDAHGGRLSIYANLPATQGISPSDAVREAVAEADVVVVDLADHSRPVLGAGARARGPGVDRPARPRRRDGVPPRLPRGRRRRPAERRAGADREAYVRETLCGRAGSGGDDARCRRCRGLDGGR